MTAPSHSPASALAMLLSFAVLHACAAREPVSEVHEAPDVAVVPVLVPLDDPAPPAPRPAFEPATWFLTDAAVNVGFVEAGGEAPMGSLAVRELGGENAAGPIQVDVRGPFEVDGSFAPLHARETRQLTVRFAGDTDVAAFAVGSAVVTIDGDSRHIWLSAVIGERPLPDAQWFTSELGTGTIVPLESAPFPHKDSHSDLNAVLVFVPHGFDPAAEYGIVAHFHGHFAELHRTLGDQQILEQFSAARRQAILIAPQGPLDASDGYFGRVQTEGGFRDLAEDVVALAFRDGIVQRPMVDRVVLTAHSGGYRPVAMVLERGGVDIAAVHLFDALYGFEPTFRDYALGGGILRSMYTPGGATQRNNFKLASRLAFRGMAVGRSIDANSFAQHAVTIAQTPHNHARCVTEGQPYRRWLEASPLPSIPNDEP